ncbi:MAG: NAD(+) diphosphatase [Pseudomonadales bacterium]|jgi:NAD+ diphosphatase|nr:NAD(+) diphosphatase [Pseudomonadales bacterium]MDP6472753.1 NAD(+) diphosphatase [Pseudomonadales bacterium]MDP6827966.1 NAD(+) diphosphatase [Pseudomonadales bacterium]MDP6971997.1 NAD(+) diphosphatase [Pseudomonadales bacterium]
MSVLHTFAGNPLDRADVLRRDERWLEGTRKSAHARFLALWQLNVLVDTREQPRLVWLEAGEVDRLGTTLPPVFLGMSHDLAHFAIDLSEIDDPHHELGLGEGVSFQESRSAAMTLSRAETGILAQSRAQLGWHRSHRFCSSCGEESEQARGGHLRRCVACGAEHFPRTDPVAIMAVVDGERCLLGQSKGPLARTGMYSALAGFIDQGESIEEAVRREVAEEAGITVGDVRYHSSQPWPFPSSLMIGCHATALSTEIRIDTEEMADVSWFERDLVTAALEQRTRELRLPGPMAIAHHLIRAWAYDEVRW